VLNEALIKPERSLNFFGRPAGVRDCVRETIAAIAPFKEMPKVLTHVPRCAIAIHEDAGYSGT
jgi:hypothetical protein